MYKMFGFDGKRGVLKPFWPAKPTGGDSGGVAGTCLRTRSAWSAMSARNEDVEGGEWSERIMGVFGKQGLGK
jgi:hypothetical protein